MPRTRALLFDLGNVCLPFDHGRMVRQLADVLTADPADVREALLDGDAISAIERGHMSDHDLHRSLCERFDTNVSADVLFEAASDIFTPDAAMDALLAELAAIDLPLILVSNTSGPHIDFVRRNYDILDHFDTLILSFEVRAAKPDRAFYEAAFEAAGCAPADCFYTDDIADYVAAAEQLGVDAEVFVDADTLRKQLSLRGVIDGSAN